MEDGEGVRVDCGVIVSCTCVLLCGVVTSE